MKRKIKSLYVVKPRDLTSVNSTELNLIFTAYTRGHDLRVVYPMDFFIGKRGLYAITRKPNAEKISSLESYLDYIAEPRFTTNISEPVENFDIIFLRTVSKNREDELYDKNAIDYLRCIKSLYPDIVFVNDPDGVSKAGSKIYDTLVLKDCLPVTHITKDESRIRKIVTEGGKWIAKPVDALGGKGVIGISKDYKKSLTPLIELLLKDFHSSTSGVRPFILQEQAQGIERRLVLLNGSEILTSYAKIHSEEDIRGNEGAGAIFTKHTPTEEDLQIVSGIAPQLQNDGLYLVAADIMGPKEGASLDNTKLLEINVRCPEWITPIIERNEIDRVNNRIIEFAEELYSLKNEKS